MTSPNIIVPTVTLHQLDTEPVTAVSINQDENTGQLSGRKIKKLNCCVGNFYILLTITACALSMLLIIPFTLTMTGVGLANSSSNTSSSTEPEKLILARGMVIGAGGSLVGNMLVLSSLLIALKIFEFSTRR